MLAATDVLVRWTSNSVAITGTGYLFLAFVTLLILVVKD